ncbi:hypothetical protein GPX89_40285 [Nocardia sp. ET3-3]|uniref:Helix-turn-helix domain-containing protein n=1 Tax=Nocardia terrae TaxID=2675851 RepID=A0A7K1V9Y5_9NOCA|nr:helix-turn-helix domain-containing protein [Nocardia terrae]MVU83464.1 hypothetical protein [Nocardia terrae]
MSKEQDPPRFEVKRHNKPRDGFTVIRNEFHRTRLSLRAKAVMCFLMTHDERYQLSKALVAECLGLNRRTVMGAIADAERSGYLVRQPVTGLRNQLVNMNYHVSDIPFTDAEKADLRCTLRTAREVPEASLSERLNSMAVCTQYTPDLPEEYAENAHYCAENAHSNDEDERQYAENALDGVQKLHALEDQENTTSISTSTLSKYLSSSESESDDSDAEKGREQESVDELRDEIYFEMESRGLDAEYDLEPWWYNNVRFTDWRLDDDWDGLVGLLGWVRDQEKR